ncbi:FabD/lysophospholipase-like protein [Dichotomopilus funicola]|uniref:FabD/lysophospholipase-like protein n=1 Tax=Dichotomopilus funicola TaxID=1934379 RepID=A0AAN6ZJD0_9PEZI|nr:FabD/lysophospholipase-like protein [Dichotomopilus funicola]
MADYVVSHAEEGSVCAHNGEVKSEVWFKHGPLSASELCHIESVQLIAESHDQGFVDDRAAGNWTWFELCILDNAQATVPVTRGEILLTWESHQTSMGCGEYQKYQGHVFGPQHDLLRYLKEGDFIAVRLCARFEAWKLLARNGELRIGQSQDKIFRAEVDHRPALNAIISAHKFMSSIQSSVQPDKAAQPFPSLPTTLKTAMTFAPTEDRPLRVLSLDGGGVRGLASLKLLEQVMNHNHAGEKPCDVFDMIGGTSTGGLIAIMLGRLEMTVEECIKKYEDLMEEVFKGSTRWNYAWNGQFHDAKRLEEVIEGVIDEKLGSGIGKTSRLLNDNQKCKTFVTATLNEGGNNRGPVILRSYINTGASLEHRDITILQAARATTAAPGFFKPQTAGNDTLVDGGLVANNPVGWVWTEILGVFGATRPTDCFLSIGTGIDANSTLVQPGKYRVPLPSTLQSFVSVATNTEIMHILFQGLIDAFAPWAGKRKYWRLNVYKVIQEWYEKVEPRWFERNVLGRKDQVVHHSQDYEAIPKFNDPKEAKEKLMEMLEEYVQDVEVKESIKKCAEALGTKKRATAPDTGSCAIAPGTKNGVIAVRTEEVVV